MNILILNHDAIYLKNALEPKFPELNIHAATTEKDIGGFIEKAEILLGIRISEDLIKRASKLQWIQSYISGVDFFH